MATASTPENELFDLAKERVKAFGSRDAAVKGLGKVPSQHRRLVFDAINAVYPPQETLTPEAAQKEAFRLQLPEQDVERAMSLTGSILKGVGQTAAQSVLPTVGAAAGTLAGPLAGVASPVLAAGGEALNQQLGITDPSLLQIALTGGLTAAPHLVNVARGLGSRSMAESLNVIGEKEAKSLVTRLQPGVAASTLFQAATQQNMQIPAGKAMTAAKEVLEELSKADVPTRVLRPAQRLFNRLSESQGSLTPKEISQRLSQWGELVGSLEAERGTGLGAAKKVLKALNNSLDDAAEDAAAPKLLQVAREAYRREQVVNRLDEAITNAAKIKRGVGGTVQFNPQEVIKSLGREKFYEKAFSATERKEIEGLLKKINEIPVIPPGGRQPFGSGPTIQNLAIRGGLAGVGGFAGGPAGMAAGIAIPTIHRIYKDIALAVSFPEGRRFIGRLLAGSDGKITTKGGQILGAYISSQFASGPETEGATGIE